MLKDLAVLSDATISRSAVYREDLKPCWKSVENHIFLRDEQSNYLQVFQNFINERKKTNRMRFFSCRPFPNIFKYKDHR